MPWTAREICSLSGDDIHASCSARELGLEIRAAVVEDGGPRAAMLGDGPLAHLPYRDHAPTAQPRILDAWPPRDPFLTALREQWISPLLDRQTQCPWTRLALEAFGTS